MNLLPIWLPFFSNGHKMSKWDPVPDLTRAVINWPSVSGRIRGSGSKRNIFGSTTLPFGKCSISSIAIKSMHHWECLSKLISAQCCQAVGTRIFAIIDRKNLFLFCSVLQGGAPRRPAPQKPSGCGFPGWRRTRRTWWRPGTSWPVTSQVNSPPEFIFKRGFCLYVLYSTLLHMPRLRFHQGGKNPVF